MKRIVPTGDSITRDDGSEVIPYVYLDTDGQVTGKAYVPVGYEPQVPDDVDATRSFPVERGTDLANKLADSNANIPDNPQHDNAEAPKENLENVAVDRPL